MTSPADTANTSPNANKDDVERLMKLATWAAVLTAGTLVVIKSIAWLATDSVALLGSLLDSGLDVLASVVNLFAVRHALSPRDRDHRFGHGKAEALAGLGQSVLICVSALYLLVESYRHFISPTPMDNSMLGIIITVIAIVLTLGLVRFQKHVIERSGSLAITADALHYKGDLLMNGAVILALVLTSFADAPWADPIIGFGIAFYILHAAWQIISQSLDQLMDKEFESGKRQRVLDIARSHNEVLDVHDLRTRSAGSWDFIQMHIELDPQISLIKAHNIADEVEAMLRQSFPRSEIILHQDPAGLEELTELEQD